METVKNTTYFVVLGKHIDISLHELRSLLEITNCHVYGEIAAFDVEGMPVEAALERLQCLGGSTKRGTCIAQDHVQQLLSGKKILLGTNDESFAKQAKKERGVKRYKTLNPLHTDREVRNKGVEILVAGSLYCHVVGYQDIELFSCVDFDKPVRGMGVGMMPAKLTNILVTLGTSLTGDSDKLTIYDPFCGFGTTGRIANAFGCHFVGSDINITPAKQNEKWRKTTKWYKDDGYITLFKHDVHHEFTKPFLKNVDVIVTEGRLGPVMNNQYFDQCQREKSLGAILERIESLYTVWIEKTCATLGQVPLVFTYPQYIPYRGDMSLGVQNVLSKQGYTVSVLSQLYQRPKQVVARRIIVAHQ